MRFGEVTATKVRLYIHSITSDSVSIDEFEVRLGTGPNLATDNQMAIHANENGGKTYFISAANSDNLRVALDDAQAVYDVEVEDGKRLQSIHKIKDGKGTYLFANLSGAAVDTYVRLRGKLVPQLWDPHTGAITEQPEYSHLVEDGLTVTRVRIALDNSRAVFVVSDLSTLTGPQATLQVESGSVSLTLTNLTWDHRYFIEKSTDLSTWFGFDDFIASGPSDPQSATADIVSQVIQDQESPHDSAAFYRLATEK